MTKPPRKPRRRKSTDGTPARKPRKTIPGTKEPAAKPADALSKATDPTAPTSRDPRRILTPEQPQKLTPKARQALFAKRLNQNLPAIRATRIKTAKANRSPVPMTALRKPQIAGIDRGTIKPLGNLRTAQAAFEALRAQIPTLLLPVRLETRVVREGEKRLLRVRVFPDQIGVDSLDRALSDEERRRGNDFLRRFQEVKDNAEAQNALWSAFAGQDPWRAAWIARVLTRRQKDEGAAFATAPLLPEAWVISGYVDGALAFEQAGRPIPRGLPLSPNWEAEVRPSDDLAIDPAVGWMFDFAKAAQVGMGVEIALGAEVKDRIDRLFVTGIMTRDPASGASATPLTAGAALERHLSALHYDWGCGFAAQGTATNNTSDVAAGWSAHDPDLDAILHREMRENPKEPAALLWSGEEDGDAALRPRPGLVGADPEDMNHHVLARALGIDPIGILRRFEHREGSDRNGSRAMNTLLWPVTWGEVLGPLLNDTLPPGATDWVRRWFIETVTGGAALPSLRVGPTPYGILPILPKAPDAGQQMPREPSETDFLSTFLYGLWPDWMAAADQVLQLTEARAAFTAPGERLVEILRQTPHPVTFSQTAVSDDSWRVQTPFGLHSSLIDPFPTNTLVTNAFSVNDSADRGLLPLYNALADQNGDNAYGDLPDPAMTGRQQRDALRAQREQVAFWAQEIRTGTWWFGGDIEDFAGDALPALEQIVASHDLLIRLGEEHAARNYSLEELPGLPRSVYRGVLGDDGIDPPLAFLHYDPITLDWPEEDLTDITVEPGPAPGPRDYLAHLSAYAASLQSDRESPAEPVFPEGHAPLLYQLIREAIRRTALDDPGLTGLLQVTDAGALDRPQITAGAAAASASRIEALNKKGPRQSLTAQEADTLRVLRSQPADRLQHAAKMLRATREDGEEQRRLAAALEGFVALNRGTTPSRPMPRLADHRHRRLSEMIRALDTLADLNGAQLEWLMSETLGLASWRLDAWITSLATAKLRDLRAKPGARRGIQIGAYGWVENLSTAVEPRPSQGFIHTPSLNHARTAAVLRSGFQAYGTDDAASPFAINLSSDRMRTAAWLFDGVRAGQDLGLLLGQRVEQMLHRDLRAADWIWPLRKAVLKLTGQPEDPAAPTLDGLELHRLLEEQSGVAEVQAAAAEARAKLGSGAGGDPQVLTGAFDALDTWIDTLADAALAESVHALVQGNIDRAGASLAAITSGDSPPPELEVLKTRPAATTLTHRVALLAPPEGSGWAKPDLDLSPRAFADPDLEALAAGLLPAPKAITIAYLVQRPGGGDDLSTVTLADLQQAVPAAIGGALDLLHEVTEADLTRESVWARRVTAALRLRDKLGAEATVVLRPDPTSFATLETCLAWKRVLLGARPLEPRDLSDGSGTQERLRIDTAGLERRALKAADRFQTAARVVLAAVPEAAGDTAPPALPPNLASALDTLARFGLDAARRPAAAQAGGTEGLRAVARGLRPRLQRALAALAVATAALEGAKANQDRLEEMRAARAHLRAVFGEGFAGTTRVRPEDTAPLAKAFAQSAACARATPGTGRGWIETMGYVRDRMRDLDDALLAADCDPASAPPEVQMVQHHPGEPAPWIALAGRKGNSTPRASLLALSPGRSKPQSALTPEGAGLAGLILDEVVDQLPQPEVNAAAALHFDAPSTEAPQTLLLALPRDGQAWSFETMQEVLHTAFDLARIRAVDGHHMPAHNQILPAVFAGTRLSPEGTV